MRIHALLVLSAVAGLTLGYGGLHVIDSAHGQTDAGPVLETGQPLTPPAVPGEAPIKTGAPIADPVDNPSGYAKDAVDAFRAGRWALLVMLVLFGVARGLLFVAAKRKAAWLKRATPSLVALSVALAASAASLSAGGAIDFGALIGALGMAVGLYLTPSSGKGE